MRRNVILTGLSFAGVVLTGAAVGWGTFKAHDILKDSGYSFKDKLKHSWKYYIPAGVLGTFTLSAIGLNSYMNYKDLAAISGAAAFTYKNRKFLEEKIREKVSDEDIKKLKAKFLGDNIPKNLSSIEVTGDGDLLCLDGYSGRWFRSSAEAVQEAERKLNEKFHTDRYCSMNDFYDFLGITTTHFGWQYGWANSEDWYDDEEGILFENTMVEADEIGNESEEPVYIIDLYTYPMECWQEV